MAGVMHAAWNAYSSGTPGSTSYAKSALLYRMFTVYDYLTIVCLFNTIDEADYGFVLVCLYLYYCKE